MSSECFDMSLRASGMNPLGINQGVTCVSWNYLVNLRGAANGLASRLNECELNVEVYGASPNKQEMESLPSMNGFFRVPITVSGNDTQGYTSSVGQVEFVLTPCQLLSNLNSGDYTYDANWHFFGSDDCVGACKFHPNGWSDATVELECPAETVQILYEGCKVTTVNASPTVCGGVFDYGSHTNRISKHAYRFPPVKYLTSIEEDSCNPTTVACCDGGMAVAHYEASFIEGDDSGRQKLTLKYVDYLGSPSTSTGDISGYLTRVIKSDEPTDVKNRIGDYVSHLKADFRPFECAHCGPNNAPPAYPGGPLLCAETNHKAIVCGTEFSFAWISALKDVQGRSTCPGGCNEEFTGTICTCPWEEAAAVAAWASGRGCVMGCSVEECQPCYCVNELEDGCNINGGQQCCDCDYHPVEGACEYVGGENCVKCECEKRRIYGCTYEGCANYDPCANIEDGSCESVQTYCYTGPDGTQYFCGGCGAVGNCCCEEFGLYC